MGRDIGDKLGPRLADLLARYVITARRDLAPHEAKVRQVATQALIDKAGHEFADHIGPILRDAIAANPDMNAGIKDYLLRTASGRHQLQAVAGHIAMAGAGSVLSTLLSNELAPFGYDVVAANPHLRLDPQSAAAARATGLFAASDQYNETAAQGFNSVRADTLYQLAQAVPDSATIGQLVNRGLLSGQDARYWIQRGGYGPTLHGPLLALREDVLSPADAALAVLRSEISQGDGEAKAALSGVTAEDFGILVANTGEPPGLESLLEAYRRRFIDLPRLERGVRQSRVRNEWIDVIEKLRYSPMSVADAVNAVVQNHLDAAAAAGIAEQNGLAPGQVNTLIENAGEPLSRTELEQLYNRGLVSQAVVIQGLRESRLKDKYVDDALELHIRLPEPRQIVAMIAHNVLTKQQGAKYLLEYGFPPETAAALIAEGTATKLGAHKDLTIGEIRTLYTDGIFDRAQVIRYAGVLGYDATEAGFLISTWDVIEQAAMTRQATGAIRTRYVTRKLDWQHAQADLTALGLPEATIGKYRRVWDIERSARIASLSEAQIVKAHKEQLITGAGAHGRLTALGYDAGDANILLGVRPGDPVPQ